MSQAYEAALLQARKELDAAEQERKHLENRCRLLRAAVHCLERQLELGEPLETAE